MKHLEVSAKENKNIGEMFETMAKDIKSEIFDK